MKRQVAFVVIILLSLLLGMTCPANASTFTANQPAAAFSKYWRGAGSGRQHATRGLS